MDVGSRPMVERPVPVERSLLAVSFGFAITAILAAEFKEYAFYVVAGGVADVHTGPAIFLTAPSLKGTTLNCGGRS